MSAISTLKRSTSTIYYHRLSSIRRHSSLPHPPHPTPIASTANSVSKYLATIAAGSSLGFLFLSSSSGSDSNNKSWPSYLSKPSIVFADWSTASEESVKVGDDKSFSSKFLQKLSLPDYSSKFIFKDSFRRKVFFNYEKRIRLRSPPEKVFEYFASSRTADGELLMKPADLMRAVVPVFPPSESKLVRDGYLIGERSPGELRCPPSEFFMLFDVNNDGHISFKEYIFLVTLLSIPESSFSITFKMFDTDNNGKIDKKEFKKVMALMRSHNRQGVQQKEGLRTGLKVSGSVEDGGLVEQFFGKDGNEWLDHDEFLQFMRGLHEEMLKLEFDHYDYKQQKTISAEDFALSMVASAEMSHINKLLDRVDQVNKEMHLQNMRINFEEFKSFAEIRKRLQSFALALFSYGEVNGLLTREDFKRAASQVCGITLSDKVIEIIFHVFDTNQDGHLSVDEFVKVLYKRERDISQPVETGFVGFLNCCWNCSDGGWIRRFLK